MEQENTNELNNKTEDTQKDTNKTTNTTAVATTSQPVVVKSSGGKGLAFFATIVAFAALGCSGLLFVQGQNTLENAKRDYQSQLDKAALGQNDNARKLSESLDVQHNLERKFNELEQNISSTNKELAQTQDNYRHLANDRVQWMILETEYTINSIAQQLSLNNNTQNAVQALLLLEKRLNNFGNADLIPLKKAISQDIANLQSQSTVDTVATSMRLERLLADVDNLPLSIDTSLKSNTPELKFNNQYKKQNWFNTLVSDVKGNLKNLVQVRKIDNPDIMLASEEQVYFIRQYLKLRLLDARIALIQYQSEIFQNDLDNAIEIAKKNLDTQSQVVQFWIKEAENIKSLDISQTQINSLQASLTAIREYQQNMSKQASLQIEENSSNTNEQDNKVELNKETNKEAKQDIKAENKPVIAQVESVITQIQNSLQNSQNDENKQPESNKQPEKTNETKKEEKKP